MKKLLLYLCLLLCLTACGQQLEETPPATPPQEDVQQPEVPEVPEIPEEPVVEIPEEPEEPFIPQWVESTPQEGDPITPQPGETSAAWDAGKADSFPTDLWCTDMGLLEKWMTVEGLTWADLDARDCDQLVLVVAQETDGVSTITLCYERQEDGTWAPVEHLGRMAGYTGSKGIQHDRQRNTRRSPAGLWGLGSAFGLAEKPEDLKLAWRDITPQSDWVCDAESPYFNTWQERDDPNLTATWNWNDVEHLENYTETYRYSVVIQYNTPPYVVPDRGCAIFFHCSDHPTEGCIGLLEEDMLNTLLWLDAEKNPHILITGYQRPEE